jgi:hypothetical protein
MKPSVPPPKDRLLQHVVADAATEDLRSATLDTLLRGARRRRRVRHVRAAAAALALPLLAAALLWLPAARRSAPPAEIVIAPLPPTPSPGQTTPDLLRTRSDAGLFFTSRPLSPEARIPTRLLAAADRTRTDLRLGPVRIDEDELLALAPNTSVLIRLPSGGMRLVLPDQPSADTP